MIPTASTIHLDKLKWQFLPIEQRLIKAISYYMDNSGWVPTPIVCEIFSLPMELFTKRMVKHFEVVGGISGTLLGMELPDTTPKVRIEYTETEINQMCPSFIGYGAFMPFGLELFYTIRTPYPMPDIAYHGGSQDADEAARKVGINL